MNVSESNEGLRAAYTPIVSQKVCQRIYKEESSEHNVTNTMMCAGFETGGQNFCEGDTGGLLVASTTNGSLRLIGIVSWSKGCALPGYPSVFSRVASARAWIKSVTGV